MKTHFGAGWVALVALALTSAGCGADASGAGDETVATPYATGGSALDASPEAEAELASIRDRFGVLEVNAPASREFQARLIREPGGALTSSEPGALRLRLPNVASDPFNLRTEAGVAIDVALRSARPAQAEVIGDTAIYRGGAPSDGSVLQKLRPDGTEDYVTFVDRPEEEELVYEVSLSNVAGLRLVEGTLEILDASSSPRLRVARPYVVGADGVQVDAELTVRGCAYDANPAAPWDRAPVAPASSRCEVHVSWNDKGVHYPAVVDPVWQTTAAMSVPRFAAVATTLSDGRILVAGGASAKTGLAYRTAEIFNPQAQSWTTTGSMSIERKEFAGVTIPSTGQVFVMGGWNGSTSHEYATSELYTPSTGTWALKASLVHGCLAHTATWFRAGTLGKVLVAAGTTSAGELNLGQVYDIASNSWTSKTMPKSTWYHTATLLTDGRILIVGPTRGLGTIAATAEVYDPASAGWSETISPNFLHAKHTATRLADGRVLVVGSSYSTGKGEPQSAEIFNPTSPGWTIVASLSTPRMSHTAMLNFTTGHVLIAGGCDASDNPVAIFNPATSSWTNGPSLLTGRCGHVGLPVSGGKWFAGGGWVPATNTVTKTVELLDYTTL